MKYTTVSGRSEYTYTEKKSEFIAVLAPVKSKDDAEAFIASVRSENRKARHSVYAYLLREGNATRYSDDGEPQGTAGMPVMEVLRKNGLTDVCAVVTRYFGGVLLGANGLVRAYSEACSGAVARADIRIMEDASEIRVVCSYSLYGKIVCSLADFGVKILQEDFGENVTLRLLARAEKAEEFAGKVLDLSAGRACVDVSDVFEADFT